MMGQPADIEEVRVSRRFAPIVGLIAGLVPAIACAQTNIDADKTPAQIFANDCATCHKSPRGLGAGKGSLMLSSFLREHYTSSKDQAAALAAYVLGAGGGENAPAARGQKPAPEQAKSTGDERKPSARSTRETAKPEEHAPATAKLQPPAEEERKPLREPRIMAEPSPDSPGRKPVIGRRPPPPTATRGRENEPEAAPSSPEPVAAPPPEPVVHENPPPPPEAPPEPTPSRSAAAPEPAPSRSAAAPENPPEPGGDAPVPRDNIPD